MTRKKITGDAPFQVEAHSFAVSPSEEGFTLQYSANGRDYTDWEESTPSGENLVVVNVAKGMYFRLDGNASEVTITY